MRNIFLLLFLLFPSITNAIVTVDAKYGNYPVQVCQPNDTGSGCFNGTYPSSTGGYSTTFTNSSLISNILTVTHNLGTKSVIAFVYDNSGNWTAPSYETIVDNNNIKIDFTGLTPLTGTWTVVVQGGSVNNSVVTDSTLTGNGLALTPLSVALTSGMVTGALGYTPYSNSNPSSYITLGSLSAGTGIGYNNSTGVISNTATFGGVTTDTSLTGLGTSASHLGVNWSALTTINGKGINWSSFYPTSNPYGFINSINWGGLTTANGSGVNWSAFYPTSNPFNYLKTVPTISASTGINWSGFTLANANTNWAEYQLLSTTGINWDSPAPASSGQVWTKAATAGNGAFVASNTVGGTTLVGSPCVMSSASSCTFNGLTTGVFYTIYAGYTQNSSTSYLSVRFNGDSGNHYNSTGMYNSGSSGLVMSQNTTFAQINIGGQQTTAGTNVWSRFDFVGGPTSNASSLYGWFIGNNTQATISESAGNYSGSAGLSSVTVATAAGSMTGTMVLYRKN